MEFSESFGSSQPGLEFELIPRVSLEEPSSFDLHNAEDMDLMNHVLTSPAYIMNPNNPLNPQNSYFRDSNEMSFTPPMPLSPSSALSLDMTEIKSPSSPSEFELPTLPLLSVAGDSFETLPPTDSEMLIDQPPASQTHPITVQSNSWSINQSSINQPIDQPMHQNQFLKQKIPPTKKRDRRVYETLVANPDGSLESRQNDASVEIAKRKKSHAEIEQRRRKKESEGFKNLGLLLHRKAPRAEILSAAIDRLQEFEAKQRKAQLEIDRLKKEVEDSEAKVTKMVENSPSDILRPLYVNRQDVDYREVFLNSGVALAINRIDGNFIDCNIAFEELTGYSRAELLSTNMFALTHRDDLPKMFACVRGMLTNKYSICKSVKKWVQKNGELFCCSCMISVVPDKETGDAKFFVCFGPPKGVCMSDQQMESTMAVATVGLSQ